MTNNEKNIGQTSLTKIIGEIEKFSDSVKELTSPITEQELSNFFHHVSFMVPKEYIQLLSYSNGINLMGDEIYGIGKECLGLSLEEAYHIEHELVANPMPPNIIPFSPDGEGNHYCFDSRDNSIIFWQHDLPSDVNIDNKVYSNLFDMITEVFIEWTLEYWNYDGTQR